MTAQGSKNRSVFPTELKVVSFASKPSSLALVKPNLLFQKFEVIFSITEVVCGFVPIPCFHLFPWTLCGPDPGLGTEE